MPKRCLNDDQRRNKTIDYSLTAVEEQQLRGLAKAADIRFTEYLRQTVLKADLTDERPMSRLRCSPGSGGNRKALCFTFAEREKVRCKASAAKFPNVSDYIYRALMQLLETPNGTKPKSPKVALDRALNPSQSVSPNRIAEMEAANLQLVLKLDRLNQEINKIGVNVNQLAHKANAGRLLPGMWENANTELAKVASKAHSVLDEVATAHVSNRS